MKSGRANEGVHVAHGAFTAHNTLLCHARDRIGYQLHVLPVEHWKVNVRNAGAFAKKAVVRDQFVLNFGVVYFLANMFYTFKLPPVKQTWQMYVVDKTDTQDQLGDQIG